MQSWPESDLPPLKAPGYVRMPGRPKKERKREPQEQPKAKRLSKVGTVIRRRKFKEYATIGPLVTRDMRFHLAVKLQEA